MIPGTGFEKGDHLEEELHKHIGHGVIPIAKPEHIEFVDSLPKTRSGKIMRRVLKAKALGRIREIYILCKNSYSKNDIFSKDVY